MERAVRALWEEGREVLGLHPQQEEEEEEGVGGAVERLELPPSPLQFLRDFVSPNRPLLVSSAATRHWPALSLWSPDDSYLSRALRSSPVSLHLTPDGRADALAPLPPGQAHGGGGGAKCFASAYVRRVDFPRALRLIRDSTSGGAAAYAQQQDDCLRGEYAAVAGDVDAHIPWASEALGCLPEAVNLWIGGSRSQTSFHKDHYENLYAVVSGEKHFLLLPPSELHRLYVRPYPAARYVPAAATTLSDEDDLKDLELELELEEPGREVPWCSVDPYPNSDEEMAAQRSRFPLYFQGPKPIQCTVRAGEILYLPSMWFHHVRQTPDCNGRTIAVNYWYDMQFDIKYAYFNFLRSLDLDNDPSAQERDGEEEEIDCVSDTERGDE